MLKYLKSGFSIAVNFLILLLLVVAVKEFFTFRRINNLGIFVNQSKDHTDDLSYNYSIGMLSQKTNIDFGLVLLDSLEKEDINQLAPKYFKKLKIGEKSQGRGILIIYARDQKILKIETGYQLEGEFPDIIISRLERAAKTFILKGNERDFFTDLLVTMSLVPTLGKENGGQIDMTFSSSTDLSDSFNSGGGGIVGQGYSEVIDSAIKKLKKGNLDTYFPSTDPKETIERYLASLSNGIGDEQLPLLTMGSRIYRKIKPRTPGYCQRIADYYKSSYPQPIYQDEKLAAMFFPVEAPVHPILLRKGNDQNWYVDEAGAWARVQPFQTGQFYAKYANDPYYKIKPDGSVFIYSNNSFSTEPLENHYEISEKIAELEEKIKRNPNQAKLYFELADVLYFETYWISAAENLIKKGLELLSEEDTRYLWRLYDFYGNTAEVNKLFKISEDLAYSRPINREWIQMNEVLRKTMDPYGTKSIPNPLNYFVNNKRKIKKYLEKDLPFSTLSSLKSKVARENYNPIFTSNKIASAWPPKEGETFPDFEMQDLDGNTYTFHEYIKKLKAKAILIEPVGMTCQACHALSGATKERKLFGIDPQPGIESAKTYLKHFAKASYYDKNIVFIQLLLYDENDQPVNLESAQKWKEFYSDQKKGDRYILIAMGKEWRNAASYAMIPGFFLVDNKMKIITDGSGTHQQNLGNAFANVKNLLLEEFIESTKEGGQIYERIKSLPLLTQEGIEKYSYPNSYDDKFSLMSVTPAIDENRRIELNIRYNKIFYMSNLNQKDYLKRGFKDKDELYEMIRKEMLSMVKEDPTFHGPYNGLGLVYYEKKEYLKSAEYFIDALERFPYYWAPLMGLMKCLNSINESQLLLTVSKRLFQLNPYIYNASYFRNIYFNTLISQGLNQEVIELISIFQKNYQNPDLNSDDIPGYLVQAYFGIGDFKKAEELLVKNKPIFNENFYYSIYIDIKYEQKDYAFINNSIVPKIDKLIPKFDVLLLSKLGLAEDAEMNFKESNYFLRQARGQSSFENEVKIALLRSKCALKKGKNFSTRLLELERSVKANLPEVKEFLSSHCAELM